jgi:hypothetical protein
VEEKMKKLLFGMFVLMVAVTMAQAALQAWWTFDEGQGTTAADSSGNGNTGLLIGNSTWGDPEQPVPGNAAPPIWTTGVNGGALLFNSTVGGTKTFGTVVAARSDSLQYWGSQWTVAFWANQASYSRATGGGTSWQRVISCPTMEIELGPGQYDNYTWPYYPGGATGDLDIAVGPTYGQLGGGLNEWYHVAIAYDGTNLVYYVNGQLINSQNVGTQMLPEDNWGTDGWKDSPFTIGGQIWPSQGFFRGMLDDVAIWGNCYIDADGAAGLYSGQYTPGTVPILPEPATMLLLTIGGLLLRRK